MNQSWTLDEGAKLVRALQQKVSDFGYTVAIGGKVLTVGEADKLDLYFHPVVKTDQDGLVAWLTVLWGQPDEVSPDIVFNSDPDRFARMIQPRIQQGPGRFLIREDVLVEPPVAPVAPVVKSTQTYKQKLVFQRADNDRIDVFIV